MHTFLHLAFLIKHHISVFRIIYNYYSYSCIILHDVVVTLSVSPLLTDSLLQLQIVLQ